MQLKFKNCKVREGKRYFGEITRYKLSPDQRILYVYVVIDGEPDSVEFKKRIEVDLNARSFFAKFCEDLAIYLDDETVELDELVGTRVVLWLRKYKGGLYVDRMRLDEEYYEYDLDEEDEETEDE